MGAATARDAPLLLFQAAGERLGIPPAAVREVTRVPRITPVPQAPPALIGLANIRGTATPVVSMAALLGAPDAPRGERLIILDGPDPAGLMVEAVQSIGPATGVREIDAAGLIRSAFAQAAPAGGSGRRSAESRESPSRQDERVALLAFRLAHQEFALPLDQVEEVIRYPSDITDMIDADPAVIGLTGWRDALLPLLSLARLAGFPAADDRRAVVIARVGRARVGLAVGAIAGVLRADPAAIDPVPPVLARGESEARIQAICRLDGGRRLVSILAADQLLRGVVDDGLATPSEGSAAAVETIEGGESLLFFSIGTQELALPIGAIREVARMPDRVSRVPRTMPFLTGLINRRGRALPVIDLARRFADRPAEGRARRVIVARIGASDVGLLVDRVSDVRRVREDRLQPAPSLAAGDPPLFERIAAADDDGMVLVASPRPLLEQAERDLLAEIPAA